MGGGMPFMGFYLHSEAIPILHDLPARSQQHRGAEGGGQAAKQRPALPGIHLSHHGHPAWGLCTSPGRKVMGTPPLPPMFLGGAAGRSDSPSSSLLEHCWGRDALILKGGDTPSASPGALTLEVRREYRIPWNGSHRWLRATVWVLRIKPGCRWKSNKCS